VVPEAKLRTFPEDIVKVAVSRGLEAIAITDHNSVEAVEQIRDVARKDGLVVLPGVELSAKGGHAIAIFDEKTPVERLRYLLRLLCFGEEHKGQGWAETPYWIDEVFQAIEEYGGLAIAAHIDRRPKGFIASDEHLQDKIRIHNSRHLSALEITVERDKKLWNHGLMPNFPKRYACIQGSDAHSPKEIGRRAIYVDTPDLTIEGLRLAFREYEKRIRFPGEAEQGHREALW